MGIILKTNDLTKKYDNKVVVDNLNIEIKEGEVFGMLGPNGETWNSWKWILRRTERD